MPPNVGEVIGVVPERGTKHGRRVLDGRGWAPKEAMKTVKDACTVIPAVLLTATAVLGIGVLISLSSWSLV